MALAVIEKTINDSGVLRAGLKFRPTCAVAPGLNSFLIAARAGRGERCRAIVGVELCAVHIHRGRGSESALPADHE